MERRIVCLMAALAACYGISAQVKDFSYKFYGQVRADLFYNSRSNSESADGLLYLYPKDHDYDAVGNDLNAKADGSLYTMYTRLGVDIVGPVLGKKVTTAAKVEFDFRGSGTNYYMVRLRQAYINFGFGKSSLLVGQTWHPFYGDVAPEILNLNNGAPFQPLSRAPQIAYQLDERDFRMKVVALWQSQYQSVGPKTNEPGETDTQKSTAFIRNGCVPELALCLDYKGEGLIAGVGLDMTSIVPRTRSEVGGEVYKVDERITSFSAEAHAKYKGHGWMVAAKTLFESNFTQANTVGGYGISETDQRTGEQTYEPIRVSATWVNVAWGDKLRPAVFAGYLKNLGAASPVSGVLGTGVGDGLDQIVSAAVELTYNLPHWKFGAEYLYTNARYGTLTDRGKVTDTHAVGNHRLVLTALFQF